MNIMDPSNITSEINRFFNNVNSFPFKLFPVEIISVYSNDVKIDLIIFTFSNVNINNIIIT